MNKIILCIILATVSGCVKNEKKEQLSHHCYYLNSGGETYCETTFVEILANPELFHNQYVTVRGWAILAENDLMLFPFPDYAERGFAGASVLIEKSDAASDLVRSLSEEAIGTPRRRTVSGKFSLLRGTLSPADVPRLGRIDEVVRISP